MYILDSCMENIKQKNIWLKIEQNNRPIKNFKITEKSDLIFYQEMYDDRLKYFDMTQQFNSFLTGSASQNKQQYRLYTTYLKWGNLHEDERYYTAIFYKKNSSE